MIQAVAQLFENEEYEKAAERLLDIVDKEGLSETAAVYGASICKALGDDEGEKLYIYNGLAINPENYELYMMLGDYLSRINPDQAYLCYENALYFAGKSGQSEDAAYIDELFEKFKSENSVNVRPVSFIILSYNTLEDTNLCLESIRTSCAPGSFEIVMVDNASTDGSVEYLRRQQDIVLVENEENEGFPGGCNTGIKAADPGHDIMLLNSDTCVPINAIFTLRMGLYSDKSIGASGSISNYAANDQMIQEKFPSIPAYLLYARSVNIPSDDALIEKRWLSGFAVLFKRDILESIKEGESYLDERFSPGNFEDNDIGRRIKNAGYKNVCCKNSFIFHSGSKSFEKETDRESFKKFYKKLIMTNRQKYIDKWGTEPEK